MITLKLILQLNAISCIGFGILFIVAPSHTAYFLSPVDTAPSMIIMALGVLLILNGLHLLWTSAQEVIARHLIIHFSLGDFLWVLATIVLILFEQWIRSTPGIYASLLVSLMVAVFGILQLSLLKQQADTR